MFHKLALAHLKGGVGKSTAALFLAEVLALEHGLRILVVDLDPQSNASFMFLSREGVEQAEKQGRTLPTFLLAYASEQLPAPVLGGFICPDISEITDLRGPEAKGRIDLLPSVPRLWFVEMILERQLYLENVEPAETLKRALTEFLVPLRSKYDLVIFDCPPGFSALTRAALLVADTIISPTIADAVSSRSLADFVEVGLGDVLKIRDRTPHHVVISKFQSNEASEVERERLRKLYDVLDPSIRYSVVMIRATERIRADSFRSFAEKYGQFGSDIRALGERAFTHVIKQSR